jgi:hypothetical protein
MKKLLTLGIALLFSNMSSGNDVFEYLGSFDNVSSTETGHCYGTSISMWRVNSRKVIGLLDIHSGLCGDPHCSFIDGIIHNNEISFRAYAPIYQKLYSFIGTVTKEELSGKLNESSTVLKLSQFQFTSKDKKDWCSTWSKIPRCKGVKVYCK